MEIKYHAQFLLDKEKDDPTAKVRYRIKWENNIVAFNIGYRVETSKWSADTQRCKINTTHGDKKVSAATINKKIRQYESACEKVFRNFDLENSIPEKLNFKNLFNLEIGKKPEIIIDEEKTLFEIFDVFMKEESLLNLWSSKTLAKMKTFKKHLKTFDEDLEFNSLDEKKLINYQYFLQDNLKLQNSTALKNFSFLLLVLLVLL